MEITLIEEGSLIYKNGVLFYDTSNEKTKLPIRNINSINISRNIRTDSHTIINIMKRSITINWFDNDSNFIGISHNQNQHNGKNTINQVRAYDSSKRIIISKQILISAFISMMRVLKQYNINLDKTVLSSSYTIIYAVNRITNIEKLMLFEAKVRRFYYSQFNNIIKNTEFMFTKRSYHPANDEINVLISFINSLLYKVCLNEIYKTKLNPAISYLHASNDRSSSLQYDISEIYKPIIGDRVLFSLINNRQINKQDFEEINGRYKIKFETKKLIIKEIDKKLHSTIKVKDKYVSYKQLIEKDCVSLKKYINNDNSELDLYKQEW